MADAKFLPQSSVLADMQMGQTGETAGPTFNPQLSTNYAAMQLGYQPETPKPPSVGEILDETEAEFAIKHPNLYAAGKTYHSIVKKINDIVDYVSPWRLSREAMEKKARAGQLVLEHAPFTKRVITPEARAEFMQLDQQHQTRALLWDTLETVAFFPAAWRGAWNVVKAPFVPVAHKVRQARRLARLKPIEDVAMREFGSETFTRHFAGTRQLKKLGVADEDEIYAVLNDELTEFIPRRISVEKKAISPGLRNIVEWVDHRPQLRPTIARLMDNHSLRAMHYRTEFQKYGHKIFGEAWEPQLERKIFEGHLNRLMPGQTIRLQDAGPELMKAIHRDMYLHPKISKRAAKEILGTYTKLMPDVISPTRVVYGSWQASHGAYDGVYKVIKEGFGAANVYDMQWNMIVKKTLEQYGLGKATVKKASGMKFEPGASKEQFENAYKALQQLDDLAQKGAKNPVFRNKVMPQMSQDIMNGLGDTERRIVQATRDIMDSIYGQYMKEKIPQIFEKYSLTPYGRMGIERLMRDVDQEITRLLATDNGLSHEEKLTGLSSVLKTVKERLNHPWVGTMGRHPWFDETGDALKGTIRELSKDFTLSNETGTGRFVGYLENYVARIGSQHRVIRSSWDKYLIPQTQKDPVGRFQGFFTKQRSQLESFDPIKDYDSMIRGRIRAQANDLFLYPKIEQAIRHMQKVEAPAKLRSYTEHWISRVLGRPSNWDVNVANWVSKTGIENLPKTLGGGPWDERKVMALAGTINNINVMAGLGFKPFAVLRDMFQPFLLVPTDLGGLKSIGHLVRGMRKQTDPAFRDYCKSIGVISEFVPEIARAERILPFGVGAKADKLRDASLWMFKNSDKWNRYVTAGAANEKWVDAVAAIGGETKLATMPNHMIKKFIRKSGLKGRYPWVRDEIMEMISKGNIQGAKDSFIRDVVADTQYLYDILESPVFAQTGGIVTKTAALFQSWWMNYGTLMEKWARTGDSGKTKVNKLFTFMLTTAAAEQVMGTLWGPAMAERTVGLGPFPSEFFEITPASWQPVLQSLKMLSAITARNPEDIERQAKAIARSAWMFVPGGLQLKAFHKGYEREGFEGLAPAILRLKE